MVSSYSLIIVLLFVSFAILLKKQFSLDNIKASDIYCGSLFGRVAQLVRALPLQGRSHRFESCSAYQSKKVAPWCSLVSIFACHAKGREFKSRRGRQENTGEVPSSPVSFTFFFACQFFSLIITDPLKECFPC